MATIQRALVQRGDLALWDGVTKTASRVDATGGTVTGLTVGDAVDVLQVYGSGTERTRTTIADAIAHISTANVPLLFATGTWSIDASITIPANFACLIPAGCVFDVASGQALTFSGPVTRQSLTWTSGSGTVVLGADSIVNYARTSAEQAADVVPSDSAIPSHDTTGEVDPRRYGYVGNGVANDFASIQSAVAVINELGGGTLRFPPNTTPRIYVGAVTGDLCDFADLDGLNILGYGCTLTVDLSRSITTSLGTCFAFDNCKNVFIDGFTTNGPSLDVSNSTVKGVEFIRCINGCRNIQLGTNRVVNWLAGFMATKGVSDADSMRSQDIDLGVLYVENCWYGAVLGFSGNNTRGTIRTDTVHRSAFVYGTSHLDLDIWSKDHKGTDVNLFAADGLGVTAHHLSDVKLRYHQGTDSDDCGTGNAVELRFWGQSPMCIRNVDIEYYIEYAGSGDTGGPALLISKYANTDLPDATDRGHKLENLRVSGTFIGSPSTSNGGLIVTDPDCTWGASDFFSNLTLENIKIDGTGSNSQIYLELASLTDQIVLKSVVSDQAIHVRQSDSDPRAPHTGKVVLQGVECPNRWSVDGTAQPLDHYTQGATPRTVRAGWSGKTITNLNVGGNSEEDLPAAVPGLQYTFVRADATVYDLDPNGSEVIRGGTAGQMLRMNTDGNMVTLKCFVAGTWEVTASQGAYSFV